MSGGRFLLRALVLVLGTLSTMATMPGRPASAVANASSNRMTGVSFLTENQPIAGSSGEFQRIKSDGANTVSFDVWWVVPSQSSSSIAPAPSITDSDADLIAAAQEARQAGLKVTLTPKFVVGTNTWRAYYNPPDPATFFSNYRTMIDHYADLAQQTGMSLFYVGSEMIDSDGYLDYWHQVIASARQHFGGPLSYEEDCREVGRFNFGDAVDKVSVSAYFPISSEASPTLGQLEAGWQSYQGVDAFAEVAGQAQRWGKPILFGEVGYEASSHAAANPCCNSTTVANDASLQSRAYQALLDTFVDQPWWGGVTWWAWNNGGPRSPEGKPAEGLIGARSVAFPSPASTPGAGGPPSNTNSPLATGTDGPPEAANRGAPPAPATATGAAPAADDVSLGGSRVRPPGPGLPDPYGLTGPSVAGLVDLRISHEGSASADHLGLTIVAAVAVITGLAGLTRFIARRRTISDASWSSLGRPECTPRRKASPSPTTWRVIRIRSALPCSRPGSSPMGRYRRHSRSKA